MSKKSWQEALTARFIQPNKRLVIVGVGHEFRGDDAVGIIIVRRLRAGITALKNCLLLDAGAAPENMTGAIRHFIPDVVLLIDAVDMQQAPGSIRLFNSIGGFAEHAASTHTLSLKLIADYLLEELDCSIALLGVQPAQAGFDTPLSAAVQVGAEQITQHIIRALQATHDP